MTRRSRKLPSIAALVVMSLGLVAPAAVASPPASATAGDRVGPGRQVVDFDRDWRFALANRTGIEVPPEYAEAVSAGYDDSGWRVLDVPHDWSIELDPTAGAPDGFVQISELRALGDRPA